MPATIGYPRPSQAPIQTRAPGAIGTSIPINSAEAMTLARFNDGDFGTGFEEVPPAGPGDIIYSAIYSAVPGGAAVRAADAVLPGTGPITQEEAEALARFNDDGEGGFDGPSVPAMTNPERAGQGETDEELDWDDYAKDALYSAGTGLAEGAIGLAGLPGDVQGLAKDGAQWLARMAGVDPSAARSLANDGARWLERNTGIDPSILKTVTPAVLNAIPGGALFASDLPTTEELRDTVEDTVGPLYEPKTSLGRVLHTAGTLAPGALVPGGLVARAANVAVPTLLSEVAGHAAKGTQYESAARVGGAAAGAFTPWGVAKALQAVPKSAKHGQAVDSLKREGVRSLTAGQELGSTRLRRLERQLGDPVKFEPQNAEFTRAVLKRAGAQGDEVTPAAMRKAADKVERDYIEGSRGSLDAFHRADRQKRNLDVVKKAVASGPHPGGKRHITPERLIAGETADNVALGKGNFTDLIEAGQTVMVPPAQHAMTGHAVRAASSAIGSALGGVPGAVIGGVAGPSVAGKVLMSRPMQSYLRNDMMPQSRWRSTVPRAGYNWMTAWRSQDGSDQNTR